MYLEELRLFVSQHKQVETEIANIAQSDTECQLVMSHPGIASFVAVAIKARVGDDASRFPTKKHFCSYGGVVPRANDSGEYKSEHGRVKRGDSILKYANLWSERSSLGGCRFCCEEILPGAAEEG